MLPIRAWRLLSVHLPPRCRFHPSCSQYALEALAAARRPARHLAGGAAGGPLPPVARRRARPGPGTERTFALTRAVRRRDGRELIRWSSHAGSIFDPIYNFFGAILAFFYGIIPNLGVSIILLTVVVMLVLFPLTAKQAKSMMAMQRAQPEIKKLQAKYKNDRAKLNEEMMKFYQENKINPLAGCLPLLVQMPIFIALFRVMREPYKHIPKGVRPLRRVLHRPQRVSSTSTSATCRSSGLPNPQYFLGMDLSQNATGGHRRVPRRAPLLHPRRPRRSSPASSRRARAGATRRT